MKQELKKELNSFLRHLNNGGTVTCFDVETTGFSSKGNDIISFSAISYKKDADKFVEVARMDQYINPGYSIPEDVVRLTGITDEMVAGCPTPEVAAELIAAFLGSNPVLCGYNTTVFDKRFMEVLYTKIDKKFNPSIHLDVLKLAKEYIPKEDDSGYKLEEVAKKLKVNEGITFHNSLSDVIATWKVFECLLSNFQEIEPESEILIGSIQRWRRGSFDRLYVSTAENDSIYYDVPSRKWVTSLDEKMVEQAVFAHLKISSVAELLAMNP